MVKLEAQLEAAREKAVKAELTVEELREEQERLRAQEGFVHTSKVPELVAPPKGLTPELEASYNNSIKGLLEKFAELHSHLEHTKAEWVANNMSIPMDADGCEQPVPGDAAPAAGATQGGDPVTSPPVPPGGLPAAAGAASAPDAGNAEAKAAKETARRARAEKLAKERQDLLKTQQLAAAAAAADEPARKQQKGDCDSTNATA